MQCTMYVKMADGVTVEQLRTHLSTTYAGEPFVKVLEKGVVPHTRHVRGSNFCLMIVFEVGGDRWCLASLCFGIADMWSRSLLKCAWSMLVADMCVVMLIGKKRW